ncbi:MAG: hypothetical protein CMJ58_26550 [Planctomycetaceae bacterium]|nr:hypothetical protein [Planctomycetaceae bacterium]
MALGFNDTNFPSASATLVTGFPFSLCGWFRVPAATAWLPLMGLHQQSNGTRFELAYAGNTDGTLVANAYDGGFGVARSTVAVTPGEWFHGVGVFAAGDDRRVYLNGGAMGTNSVARTWSEPDFFFAGALDKAYAVDAAEVGVFASELSIEHAVALAGGVSPRALARSHSLVAYQDFLTRLNRPGVGPVMSAAAAGNAADHPPLRAAASPRINVPFRVEGPWMSAGSVATAAGAAGGQTVVAGAATDATNIFGEVSN